MPKFTKKMKIEITMTLNVWPIDKSNYKPNTVIEKIKIIYLDINGVRPAVFKLQS